MPAEVEEREGFRADRLGHDLGQVVSFRERERPLGPAIATSGDSVIEYDSASVE